MMSDNTKRGFERWGWERPGEAGTLENGAKKGSIVGDLLDSEEKIKESLNNVTKLEENVVEVDKNPIYKKTVDVFGRNVIEYKNGTKVIQDAKNNTQELIGKDGSWSQYSKQSGEWKKIDEGKYTEKTSESGDKYTQIEHVKDGKIFKVSRMYESGKMEEEILEGNVIKTKDSQKIDMLETKNKIEKTEYTDGGTVDEVKTEEGDKKPYGTIFDQPVEKGEQGFPEVKEEESVNEVKTENKSQDNQVPQYEDLRNDIKDAMIKGEIPSGYWDDLRKQNLLLEEDIIKMENDYNSTKENIEKSQPNIQIQSSDTKNNVEISEKPLDPEQKKQKFLEKTINDLTYYDINDKSDGQNEMVRDSIQASINQAQDLKLDLNESQKQNLYRTVDLLRYPTDETLKKYQFNDEADRKNVADLVRIKNPELANKILKEGKIVSLNQTAVSTNLNTVSENGIDNKDKQILENLKNNPGELNDIFALEQGKVGVVEVRNGQLYFTNTSEKNVNNKVYEYNLFQDAQDKKWKAKTPDGQIVSVDQWDFYNNRTK